MAFPKACLFKRIIFIAFGFLTATSVLAQHFEPLSPLPIDLRPDTKKVALGAQLFQDVRFSKGNDVACVSCHQLNHGGADSKPFSTGTGGIQQTMNTPTIFNVAFNFRQLWTGSEVSIENVIHQKIKNPYVFNSNWQEIIKKLSDDKYIQAAFKQIYPEGLTTETVLDALTVYQHSLVTPSRFDWYLRGDSDAISSDEKRGYERFKFYGCVRCHQGINIGGNMYQKFGIIADYFSNRATAGALLREVDKGRYNITHQQEDMFVFKVPSLRNIEKTAPYFHDGSAETLETAVDAMLRFQLGREIPTEDKTLIIKFLRSLTGEGIKD